MKIFLIAGKARSGKDSVANSIKNYYDQKKAKTVLTEFSKYIKLFATEMIDWEYNKEPKPRKFLQNMGTFIRINLQDPDFFIRRMQEDIKIYEKFFDVLVISDVRFPKEILKMKESHHHCYSIYVVNEHGHYDLKPEESNHETEKALDTFDDFDYIIVNDDQKNLNKKISDILEDL
jgi:hypothetical protein